MKTSIVSKNNPENRRLAHPDARRPSPVERRKRVQFDFAGSSAILTVIPLLLLAWALALRWASGPFWLGHNSDPAYPYLFSSLSLSQGLTVWHTDHPGATLQWLGMLLLYPFSLFPGPDGLVHNVLTHPEFFLTGLHVSITLLLFASLFTAGVLIRKWTGRLAPALLFQSGIFTSTTARCLLSEMAPEPLLLFLAVCLSLVVIYHLYGCADAGTQPIWRYGIVAGLGLGLKLTFAPVALLPLFLLRGTLRRVGYISLSMAVFLLLTANPLMNWWRYYDFIRELVLREGYNRPRSPESSVLGGMIDGLGALSAEAIRNEKLLLVLILAFIVVGIGSCRRLWAPRPDQAGRTQVRIWLGLLTVGCVQVILAANGPQAKIHYLAPVLGLVGLMMSLTWIWADSLHPILVKSIRLCRPVSYLVFAVSVLALGHSMAVDLVSAKAEAMDWREAIEFRTTNHLQEIPTVFYYRASDPTFALHFGNTWAGGQFSEPLNKARPEFLHFNRWTRSYDRGFSEKLDSIEDLLGESDYFYIQGAAGVALEEFETRSSPSNYAIQRIFTGSVEQILEVSLTKPDDQDVTSEKPVHP